MTRIIILSFVLLTSAVSNAQIESGRKFIGSTLSISGYQYTLPNNSFYKSGAFNVNLNPRFGKFVRQNVAMGGGLIMGYSREIFNTNSNPSSYETQSLKNNTISFGAEFFTRLYQPLTEKLYLHLDANIGVRHSINYNKSTYTYASGGATEIESQSGTLTSRIALVPGLTYFAKPNFALELNYGLLHFSNALSLNDSFSNLASVHNNYGFSFQGSTVSVGANFFF
jgi:hypothetical protein